jgi:trimeric autotransporter adhesin
MKDRQHTTRGDGHTPLIQSPFIYLLFILIFAWQSPILAADIISTVAGDGNKGYSGDGAAATLARLDTPAAITLNNNGDLYIVDTNNHRIRRVDPTGTITTVAGDGNPGFVGDGGSATAAQLNSPLGIAIDSAGHLYIADTENHCIRKIETSGTISTVAGDGNRGYSGDGGAATSAKLNEPMWVALDSAGNFYIADTGNNVIRKVDVATGNISTVAGDSSVGVAGDGGPATAAKLSHPTGLDIDAAGNFYIADSANHRIRKVDTTGNITTFAGEGSPGFVGDGKIATAAQLNSPTQVRVDSSGQVYIADTANHRIRQVSPENIITTLAGDGNPGYSGDGGSPTAAKLNSPQDILRDNQGNFYIADSLNHLIRKISSTDQPPTSGNVILTVSSAGTGKGTITAPSGGGAGINCGTQCAEEYPVNTEVTLTATPDASSVFTNWGGQCSGTDAVITVMMNNAKTCTATFTQAEIIGIPLIDKEISGVGGVSGLAGVNAVALSADGLTLYATAFTDSAVTVFNRDPKSGALTFKAAITNSDIGVGLQGANAVAVSPDDKHVYVASALDNAVVVFTRDTGTGEITLVEIQQDGVNGGDGLGGASAIAISPDNRRVYVTGNQDNALTVFDRDVNTGALTFLQMQQDDAGGVNGLKAATGVAVSPDNLFIYVTGSADNAIAVFTRNAAVGEIGYVGLYENGTAGIIGLTGAYGIAISPDNNHLYVTGNADNALLAFLRNPVTGELTYLQTHQDGENGVNGLSGSRGIAISPTGHRVYVASANDNALALFDRDSTTGQLTFKEMVKNGINNVTTLDGATAVASSSDGASVYLAALFSNAITGFSTLSTDLQISMIAAQDRVAINSPLVYSITVTNRGPDPASGVTLIDTLPAGITFSTAEATQGSCSHDASNNVVNCALETLAAQAAATVTLTITTPPSVGTGTLSNQATVTSDQVDPNLSNNSITQDIPLVESIPTADLKVDITSNLETVSVESPLIYTVNVINQGPHPANEVVLTNTLPPGVTFNGKDTDTRCSYNAGIVTCSIGTLAVNTPVQIPVHVVTTNTPGAMTLTAHVKSAEAEPTPANNTATKENTVGELKVDLAILDATATPSTTVGHNLIYTITVTNHSTSPAPGVVLSSQLPKEVKYVSDTAGCSYAQSKLTCELGTLVASGSKPLGVTAQAIQKGTNISTAFTVTSGGTDTDESNNSKSTIINSITGEAADLVVTASDGGDNPILIGNKLTYSVVVTNNGPNEAPANVHVTLSGNNVLVGTITGDNCGAGIDFQCSTNEPIPVGGNATITVEATPTTVGNLILTAEANSTTFDPTQPNITTLETAVSNKETDLEVTLTAEPTKAFLEKTLTYTTSVTNKGPHEAAGIVVRQELPPSVTYLSATGSQGEPCTFENNVVSCPLGPLNLNDSATVLTRVIPTLVGKLNSTVRVDSETFDPTQTNNTAQLETEVAQFTTDLSISITDDPDPGLIDNAITYTLTLGNSGPDLANNVQIISQLPDNVVFKSPATLTPAEAKGLCTDSNESNQITCTIETLPNEGTVTITLIVMPISVGEYTLSASVTGNEFDANDKNNSASATTRVNTPSTLFFVEAQDRFSGVEGLGGIMAVTLSPDGQQVYATGFSDNTLIVLTRNTNNGQLSFAQVLKDDTNDIDGLGQASNLTTSPEGEFIYVTGFSDNAVAVFSRESISNTLTFIEVHKKGTNDVDGLGGALAVTATENHVYVASHGDDAIALFNRDPESGKLTFVEAIRIEEAGQQLDGANALTVTPDGQHLLVTCANNNSLAVFSRDTSSGQLSLIQTLKDDKTGGEGLDSPTAVIVSADGQHVYTTSGGSDNALSVFKRTPETGLLTFLEKHQDDLGGVDGLNEASALTLSSDGLYIYVASRGDNAVAAFRRQADTGTLSFVETIRDSVDGVEGLSGARSIALSPSGVHLYVAGFSDNALAVLSRAMADLSIDLSDSEDPIKVGENLPYRITVTNNGPHQATKIKLENSLPKPISLISFSPSQGRCTASGNEKLTCELGALDKGAKLTLSVIVSPIDTGELSNQVTVTANEFDPTPNSVTETTQVNAEADLWLSAKITPEPARFETEVTYEITVINNGPDLAKNITLTNTLPEAVKYISSEVNTDKTPCFHDDTNRSLNCTISEIGPGANGLISIVVLPLQEGSSLSNTASVSAPAFDSDLTNNRITTSTPVVFNVIEDTYNNSGKNLHNYQISPSGAVIGGTVSGTIQNQGLLSDVWILPDTRVSGGKLSKNIINEGVIQDAQLLSNTTIKGGEVRGTITGFPTAPATLNAKIAGDAQLSQIIIGNNSQVDPTAKIGQGVVFVDNRTIPAGINLTGGLLSITGPIKGSQAVALSSDILQTGGNLLEAFNAIPDLKNNNLVFLQDQNTGNLYWQGGNDQLILWPIAVYQGPATPGIGIKPDAQLTFTTENGRQIILHPGIENPTALETALIEWGLVRFEMGTDGNLNISGDPQFKIRPDLFSRTTDNTLPLGLEWRSSALLSGLNELVLRYQDNSGGHREQVFYPVAAHPAELESALQAQLKSEAITFHHNGSLSVKIGPRTHIGVFDYTIRPGTAGTSTQLLGIADKNGDGTADFQITYNNGDQQILYQVPAPSVSEEIQGISAVQAAGYNVSEESTGGIRLEQGDKRIVMNSTEVIELESSEPTGMTINPDGSGEFITENGLKILTQPKMQDLAGLESVFKTYGVSTIQVENNGNLSLAVTDNLSFSLRPGLESTPAWSGMALGLHTQPTTLPGVLTFNLVFKDENGNLRQQNLYPAPRHPQKLYNYFANLPGIESVIFNNNGGFTISGGDITFRGIFDAAVTSGHPVTGNIQMTLEADTNEDGFEEVGIVYETGEKQLIYQSPVQD